MKNITLKHLYHRDKKCLGLHFAHDSELIQLCKNLSCLWSQTNKCWYIANNPYNLKEIFRVFKGKAFINAEQVFYKKEAKKEAPVTAVSKKEIKPKVKITLLPLQNDEVKGKILKFKYWMLQRRYSDNTINTYIDALHIFFRFFSKTPIHKISNEDLIRFNNHYILKNNFSASYQGQIINAIKLFYSRVQDKELNTDKIERPKKSRKLPNVLSKEEVKAILNSPLNIKHKAMLSLIYACGLRSGELLALKPEHVDSKRNILIIKQAKGRKDRIVPISKKLIELLREYYLTCKPAHYLFEGQVKGEPYTAKSLQMVLKKAVGNAKIKKPVSLHWLRHSYATHLLENGTDLRYIQEMLGHNSSRTTEIYTHVSTRHIQQIISPFDYL